MSKTHALHSAKKTLAMILAVLMVVMMLPTMALADEDNGEEGITAATTAATISRTWGAGNSSGLSNNQGYVYFDGQGGGKTGAARNNDGTYGNYQFKSDSVSCVAGENDETITTIVLSGDNGGTIPYYYNGSDSCNMIGLDVTPPNGYTHLKSAERSTSEDGNDYTVPVSVAIAGYKGTGWPGGQVNYDFSSVGPAEITTTGWIHIYPRPSDTAKYYKLDLVWSDGSSEETSETIIVDMTALTNLAGSVEFTNSEITQLSYFTDANTIESKVYNSGQNGWSVEDGKLTIKLDDLLGTDKTAALSMEVLEFDLSAFFAKNGVVSGSTKYQDFRYTVNKEFGGVKANTEYGLWIMTKGGTDSVRNGAWYGNYASRADKQIFPATGSFVGLIVQGTDDKAWLYLPIDETENLDGVIYTFIADDGTVYTLGIDIVNSTDTAEFDGSNGGESSDLIDALGAAEADNSGKEYTYNITGTLEFDEDSNQGAPIVIPENVTLNIGSTGKLTLEKKNSVPVALVVAGGLTIEASGSLDVKEGGILYIGTPPATRSLAVTPASGTIGIMPMASSVNSGVVEVDPGADLTVEDGGIVYGYWGVSGDLTVEAGGILTWDGAVATSGNPAQGSILVGGDNGAFIELEDDANLIVTANGTYVEEYELVDGNPTGTVKASINNVGGDPFVLGAYGSDGQGGPAAYVAQTFTISDGTLTATDISDDGLDAGTNNKVTVNLAGDDTDTTTYGKIVVKANATFVVEQFARVVLGKKAEIDFTDTSGGTATVTNNATVSSFGIVDSLFSPITPSADSKYTGGRTIDAPTAAISNVTVAGSVNNALPGGTTITITITNDTFKTLSSANATGWFANLPAGLSASVTATGGQPTATITISGTPTAMSSAAIALTIPGSALNGGGAITVTANPDAKYAINSGYTVAIGASAAGGTIIGQTKDVTVTPIAGLATNGKFLVVQITENSKVSVTAIKLTNSTTGSSGADKVTISYQTSGAIIDVWLMSDLSATSLTGLDPNADYLAYDTTRP